MAAAGGHWVKIAQGNIGALMFVPKGQTAEQVVAAKQPASQQPDGKSSDFFTYLSAKPQGSGWPDSVGDLQTVKGLGGSTGAKLVQDKAGNLYVMKKGGSADHLTEESVADQAYKAAGVDVPDLKVYNTPDGPVKLAKYVEGQTLETLQNNDPAAYNKAVVELQKNFATDAVLANWDVIGLDKDNVMLGADGKVYRIDNGGALRYRAQGGAKGSSFNEYPNEIFTMRGGGHNSSAASVFGKVPLSEVAKQASAMQGKASTIMATMPKGLTTIMAARINRMGQFSTIYNTLSGKYSDKWIQKYTEKLWSGLADGSITYDPQSPAQVLSSFSQMGFSI